MARIHLFGASGSGTTTLAGELSRLTGWPAIDTDDHYWLPTDPPYRLKRPVDERLRGLRREIESRPHVLLAGSFDGWGDPLLDLFDVVVFVTTETPARVERLRLRERRRFGAAIEPGGAMYETSRAFLDWAEGYERGDLPGRSRVRHERWIRTRLVQPLVRISNDGRLEDVVPELLAALEGAGVGMGSEAAVTGR